MKILEEIKRLNNINVWEAAALTHRNNLLKLFISNNDQIVNYPECLQKGLEGVVKGNNLKGLQLLMEFYKTEAVEALNANNLRSQNQPFFKSNSTKTRTIDLLLLIGSESDHQEMGKILISKGADINAKGIIYQNLK